MKNSTRTPSSEIINQFVKCVKKLAPPKIKLKKNYAVTLFAIFNLSLKYRWRCRYRGGSVVVEADGDGTAL